MTIVASRKPSARELALAIRRNEPRYYLDLLQYAVETGWWCDGRQMIRLSDKIRDKLPTVASATVGPQIRKVCEQMLETATVGNSEPCQRSRDIETPVKDGIEGNAVTEYFDHEREVGSGMPELFNASYIARIFALHPGAETRLVYGKKPILLFVVDSQPVAILMGIERRKDR